MEIRPLRPDDDRSAFDSGDPDLDGFLRRFAGQNQFRHHLGTTHLAVESGRIPGYVTVSAGSLEVDKAPAGIRKRLPSYPLPILRLARLATDLSARGQGVGRKLVREVFRTALSMSRSVGCAGVVVDAKADSVAFYERLGFMKLDPLEGSLESRPAQETLFLPLGDIEIAAGETGKG